MKWHWMSWNMPFQKRWKKLKKNSTIYLREWNAFYTSYHSLNELIVLISLQLIDYWLSLFQNMQIYLLLVFEKTGNVVVLFSSLIRRKRTCCKPSLIFLVEKKERLRNFFAWKYVIKKGKKQKCLSLPSFFSLYIFKFAFLFD